MNRIAGGPYIGLRRFEAEDAHLFFGREREVLAIIARVARTPIHLGDRRIRMAERDHLHRQNGELESRVRTLSDTVAEREKKVEDLGDERAKLASEIDSLRAATNALKVEIEALRSENAALESAIAKPGPKRWAAGRPASAQRSKPL